MARPFKKRRVGCNPQANYFKPRGIPVRLFKIENDVIVHIEELVRRVPYGQNSVWA